MPAAQARARFRRFAGKPLGRSCVDDLRAVVGKRHAHVGKRSDGTDIHFGMEGFRRPFYCAMFQRPAFGFPLWQSAVEYEDLLRAEKAKGPPYARRGIKSEVVVDDNGVAVADSQRADGFAKLLGARQ